MKVTSAIVLALLITCLFAFSFECNAQTDRTKSLSEITRLRLQLRQLEKDFLDVSAEDRAKYDKEIPTTNGGIFRLLPRPRTESESVLTMRGGGAYYSFTRLTNEYNYGSDLELQNDVFSVGFAGADYGLIVNLGDVPLASLNLESPGVSFLSNIKASTKLSEARMWQRQCSDGIEKEGLIFKNRTGAAEGVTYALRSLNFDNSDVLVGLRVVKRDIDGSMIIIWRMLKQFPSPVLMRDKVE